MFRSHFQGSWCLAGRCHHTKMLAPRLKIRNDASTLFILSLMFLGKIERQKQSFWIRKHCCISWFQSPKLLQIQSTSCSVGRREIPSFPGFFQRCRSFILVCLFLHVQLVPSWSLRYALREYMKFH